MGAGASTKGYTDKKPALETLPADANGWLDLDGVKGLFGNDFNETVQAAFDKAKNDDGKVHKAHLFVEACLIKVASDDDGLLAQPKAPKKQTCVAQIYVNSHEFGGTDKSCNGHRYDTMPFCNGMINAGMACYPVHYVHSQHDTFFAVMDEMDAILVRCNPGQIKADGGDQQKFDDAMRALQKKGKPVWPSPDVMEFMGAKDALTKIKDLNIGMPDTGTYYTEQEFIDGFKKSMKFQPRVIKQNRGSSGEGIWIINLKKGDYCSAFGDANVEDSDELILMEANDNHVEEHTVGEFIAWCIHGRDAGNGAGDWKSKGTGKYLEGGKAAGGQLTDQRFACRILEGELRFNMVNDVCLGVIHKVPAPGGMSAVGGTGSEYFFYDNGIISDQTLGSAEFTAYVQKEKSADGNYHRCATDEGPKKVEEGTHEKKTIGIDLKALLQKFIQEDCPVLMKTLDLGSEPIPLWWTADMINASLGECWTAVPVADQKWVVGEFNCSCVGISKCLAAYCKPDTPNVSWKDIPTEEARHATKYGDIVGKEAAKMLGVVAEAPAVVAEAPAVVAEAPAEVSLTAEQQESVKKTFEAIDADKSGAIDPKELKTALTQLGLNLSEEEMDAIFKQLDINLDGKVTLDEYLKMVTESMKHQ